MGTYINKGELKKPKDTDEIWKYMDFTKFVSMLHYKSIHFTRVDKLKDPYDASITSFLVEYTNVSRQAIETTKSFEKMRQKLFVSCWHINNETDNAALWKVYMKSDEGIAIQTTVRRLITTLEDSNKDINFDLASVNYDTRKIFRETTTTKGKTMLVPNTNAALFIKRACFKYENELRVFVAFDDPKSTGFNWEDLDINSLIESIRVNPEADPWVVSLVRDLAKSYKIEGKVCKSKIY